MSKFANVAKARLKQEPKAETPTTQVAAPQVTTITQAELDAITPDQASPYATVGCKVTRDAAHHFSIQAKVKKLPVADVIRRALLEAYGVPPVPGE